jgi:hypothetical protein
MCCLLSSCPIFPMDLFSISNSVRFSTNYVCEFLIILVTMFAFGLDLGDHYVYALLIVLMAPYLYVA